MFGWTTKLAPRRMADISAACDGGVMRTRGLLGGTPVATAMGWRTAEALMAGDLVLTFDHGLQPLIEVRRETFWVADMMIPSAFAPLSVPAGALGNSAPFEVLADQGLLVESDAACDANGDPFAVIPARTLEGYRGIARTAPPAQIEIITLIFADEQVIYGAGGALIHCPLVHLTLCDAGADAAGYDVMTARDARFLVDCMHLEDQMGLAA